MLDVKLKTIIDGNGNVWEGGNQKLLFFGQKPIIIDDHKEITKRTKYVILFNKIICVYT